ncbi:MAG: hypothetical protein HC923_10900 [Myxococcales bacterium]|nr:hypothetical protein [Myxococcales bacterium]
MLEEIELETGYAAEVVVRAAGDLEPIAGARIETGDAIVQTSSAGEATLARLLGPSSCA